MLSNGKYKLCLSNYPAKTELKNWFGNLKIKITEPRK
jgi:hypothetical protein